VVRRSRARIGPEQRRFSAVLVDVFYDYLLAISWDNYASTPLAAFTRAFYADIQSSQIHLPESAQEVVDRIVRYDLLGSYREIQGVERSLQRLSMRLASRWHRTFALESGVADLIAHQDDFAADFAEFFPSLQAHVDLFNLDRERASFP
jgi:acyl carrier protein phosphodiesterase